MKRLLFFTLLFGMISQAMEPLIIKDFNGTEFILNENQKCALARCQMLKPFLVESERPEGLEKGIIDFGGVPRPFIIQVNIQQLADIIANPEEVKKINDNKAALELFQLADYLMAPKKIVRLLAQDAKAVTTERVAELNNVNPLNKEQEAELCKLKYIQLILDQYSVTINSLLKRVEDKESLYFSKETVYGEYIANQRYLDLSYANLKEIMPKKLTSLKGIEQFKDSWWSKKTIDLRLEGHELKEIDISYLKKLFPSLKLLWLKDNSIQEITGPIEAKNLEIDLRRNPLKSIRISTPENCNNLNFIVRGNKNVQVEFPQSKMSKIKTWIKSFAAKSKFVHHYLMPSFTRMCIYASLGVLYKMFDTKVSDNWRAQALLADPTTMAVAYDNKFDHLITSPQAYEKVLNMISLRTDLLKEFEWTKLFFSKMTVAPVKEFLPALLAESTQGFFEKWIAPCAQTAYKFVKNFTIAEWIGWIVVGGDYTDFNPVTRYQSLEWNNPYRIRVEKSNEVIDFPSNYTYNLFGKN